MTKPKPCPFCGAEPHVGPMHPETVGLVECVNLECPAQPEVEDGCDIADERGTAAYIELAIKRWNRRA